METQKTWLALQGPGGWWGGRRAGTLGHISDLQCGLEQVTHSRKLCFLIYLKEAQVRRARWASPTDPACDYDRAKIRSPKYSPAVSPSAVPISARQWGGRGRVGFLIGCQALQLASSPHRLGCVTLTLGLRPPHLSHLGNSSTCCTKLCELRYRRKSNLS